MSKSNPTLKEVFGTDKCWESHPTGDNLTTGGHTNYNPIYFATAHTAKKVAEIMDGKIEVGNHIVQMGGMTQNLPNRMVRLAVLDGEGETEGRLINAGLVADAFNHGQMRINIEAAYRQETGRPWFTFKMPWDAPTQSDR